MTAWFLLFFSVLHNSPMLAGPYPDQQHCEQHEIIVETFASKVPAYFAPKCIERPAALAPQWR